MDKERMCIACRQMKDKRQLVRIVKNKDGKISVDLTGKQNGRGAYICKDRDCLAKMKKQKSLHKAFKINVDEEIYNQVEEAVIGLKQN